MFLMKEIGISRTKKEKKVPPRRQSKIKVRGVDLERKQ